VRLIPLAFLSFILSLILASSASRSTEAPTGFDNKSNGVADDATHQADQTKFEEVEQLSDGLGPLFNAQSCRECHQSPVSGAASQVTELRVGHQGPEGHFHNPEIPIAHGAEVISAVPMRSTTTAIETNIPTDLLVDAVVAGVNGVLAVSEGGPKGADGMLYAPKLSTRSKRKR
jgi:hypothetical protein